MNFFKNWSLICFSVFCTAASFAEKAQTTTGAEFTRVSQASLKALGITNPKKFGEAWEDPSGLIWGDIAKQPNSYPHMDQRESEAYCKKLGAELPTGWPEDENGKYGFPNRDSDFVRLRKYMGARYAAGTQIPKGYTGQVLRNLDYYWFWSSSDYLGGSRFTYFFKSDDGRVYPYGYTAKEGWFSVRCVVRSD